MNAIFSHTVGSLKDWLKRPDLNIFLYQKFGNAVQLSRSKLTERKITEALQMIITDSKYRQKAKEAQVIINSVNTGDIIKSVFFEHLSGKC